MTQTERFDLLVQILADEGYPSAWYRTGRGLCYVATSAPAAVQLSCIALVNGVAS